MDSRQKRAVEKLLEHYGTQEATARALGVAQPSVHAWAAGKGGVSAVVAIRAERKTDGLVSAEDLCPAIRP